VTSDGHKGRAIMAKRYEDKSGADYYPTPPGATRALLDWLDGYGIDVSSSTVLEPAAGGGHMASVLGERFGRVVTNEPFDWGFEPDYRYDFISSSLILANETGADWLITNPPFKLFDEFALAGVSNFQNVALLARLQALEGGKRYEKLFSVYPPSWILVFINRVTMVKGKISDGGTSGAMAYAWYIWLGDMPFSHPRVDWIRYEKDS